MLNINEIESDFVEIVSDYFFGIQRGHVRVLNTVRTDPPSTPFKHIRHNYQRDWQQSHMSLAVSYSGINVAYLDCYPKKQVFLPVVAVPSTQRIQKIIENAMYYKFPDIKLERELVKPKPKSKPRRTDPNLFIPPSYTRSVNWGDTPGTMTYDELTQFLDNTGVI